MKTYSKESLVQALEAVTELNASDLVEEFNQFEHFCTPGSYCALALDPHTGETYTISEVNWSCSADEYFKESGILSLTTLLSRTREHWSPSPDDGFERDIGRDYAHPDGDYQGWRASENLGDIAQGLFDDMDFDEAVKYTGKGVEMVGDELFLSDHEAFLAALGWEWFSVGDSPVEGWLANADSEIEDVENQLSDLIESIKSELADAVTSTDSIN